MIIEQLRARLRDLGANVAVIDGDNSYTYYELLGAVDTVGSTLDAHGVTPHEPVILHGDVSFGATALLLALALRKAVVIPVVHLTPELQSSVEVSCQARRLVTVGSSGDFEVSSLGERHAPLAPRPMYDKLVESGSAGLVLLSSGSTGPPKAILHDFDALISQKLDHRVGRGATPPSVLLMLLFDHIGGVNTLLGSVLGGRPTVVLTERTPSEACRLIEKHRIKLLPTSPTFLNLLLLGNFHKRYDISSLRMITYGTESMPAELLRRIGGALPRVRLLQTFGTSETGVSTTISESSKSTRFKIDDPGVQHRIVDGELQLKTKTQFLGYLNHASSAVTEDGWFRTGDLAELDDDGYLTITGRLRDVINVGGEKVLPLEIESVLLSSPLIKDCTAYGQPNAITGQAVCVDVVTGTAISKSEVRIHVATFLGERLDRYKVPARVNVVETLEVSDRFKKRRGGHD